MSVIKTYQDFERIPEGGVPAFIEDAIDEFRATEAYKTAVIADEYDHQKNTTIMKYRKLLYTMRGVAVPDNFSANHKMASNFFNRFVTQECMFLLGNGLSLTGEQAEENKAKLGNDFDGQLQKVARASLVDGLAFGFWDYDSLRVFRYTEFCPLWDEETGGLRAGIRFWQLDETKPMRATLYEEDGYREYIKTDKTKGFVPLDEKKPYIVRTMTSVADGVEIIAGENYGRFPVVPLWGSPLHQSELVGIREEIDCYDLIRSGFANDLDDASQIYWTIQNGGGMDDVDLAKFIERMKVVKAAVVEGDGAKAEPHTVEVPYQSRETYLERLEKDMYKDFMAVDVSAITAGAVTATQIKAAYEPLNSKCDQFEYCILDFLQAIFELAGVEGDPVFVRSQIVNMLEQTQMVIAASGILDVETVLRHLPFLTVDEIPGILERLAREEVGMTSFGTTGEEGEE